MNTERIDELIERYLDEIILPEEMDELNRMIVSDPEAARRFDRRARFDVLVERCLCEQEAEEALKDEIEFSDDVRRSYVYTLRHIRPAWRNWLERLWGPTGSIILHAVIILLLVKFIIIDRPPKREGIEVALVPEERLVLDDLEWKMEAAGYPEEIVFSAPEEPARASMNPELLAVDASASAPLNLRPALRGRPVVYSGWFEYRSASERQARLEQYAGPWADEADRAVVRAMDWLSERQYGHGAWPGRQNGMTGLALLTYLGRGETTASADYGRTVERAIRFLLASAQDGYWGMTARRGRGGDDHSVYEHAIATCALAEAYAMMRIPAVRPVLERAVRHMLDGQQAGGGWDYGYNPDESVRVDLSVTGWHIQALVAARAAGIEADGLDDALRRAARFCKSMQLDSTGEFSYSRAGAGQYTEGMTGTAVWCLHLLGEGDSKESRRGARRLRDADFDWNHPVRGGLYAWYFITQARFAAGADWDDWNSRFAPGLIVHQRDDGSWENPGPSIGFEEGPVYSTTLAALTLSVYYRYSEQAAVLSMTPVWPGDSASGYLAYLTPFRSRGH